MRSRALGPVFLLALLIGLVPLAHASPPDQTWLPGLYDNADYDDVVSAVAWLLETAHEAPLAELAPVMLATDPTHPVAPSCPGPVFRAPCRPRGPPRGAA